MTHGIRRNPDGMWEAWYVSNGRTVRHWFHTRESAERWLAHHEQEVRG